MLDNNTVYFLNIIWTYCTCMYYVSEINEYYYNMINFKVIFYQDGSLILMYFNVQNIYRN